MYHGHEKVAWKIDRNFAVYVCRSCALHIMQGSMILLVKQWCQLNFFFHWNIVLILKSQVILNFKRCCNNFNPNERMPHDACHNGVKSFLEWFLSLYNFVKKCGSCTLNETWRCKRMKNENTFSKILFPQCELEPAIIRSKRERSTTDLIRHK